MRKCPARGFFLAAAVAAFGVAFSACSQAVPSIQFATLRLVYRPSSSEGSERLSFFVLATDDDGFVDLEELYLVNDRSQLYWKLTADDWLVAERSGQTWVGSHSISMSDGGAFPRGVYRALLVDKGGDRAERSLTMDAPVRASRPFPTLNVADGAYRVQSDYPKNLLVAYDASGAAVRNVPLKTKDGKLADLALGSSIRSVALWAEDEASGV
ncbi:MAG: hypothetical protein A2Y36_18845, partial [Treponema sp. GWA1_62_8]